LSGESVYRTPQQGALRRGDVVTSLIQLVIEVEEVESFGQLGPDVVVPTKVVTHPVSIVMTPDCDLDWDFQSRQSGERVHKQIPNVLFLEVMIADDIRLQAGINRDIRKRIYANADPRWQYLEAVPLELDAIGKGLPSMVLDFKRLFTVPTIDVYRQLSDNSATRRACLNSPFAEHLASRFFAFQARVALPREHRPPER